MMARLGVKGASAMRGALAALIAACLLQAPSAGAGQLSDFLGLGARSGKIARLQHVLYDDMFVTSVVWSPDGKYIAAASIFENEVHIWDVQQRKIIAKLRQTVTVGTFHNLSWSPDGRYLPVCDYRGHIHIYDAHNWSEAHLIVTPLDYGCWKTAFSSDSQQLAVLGHSLTVFSTLDWGVIKFCDLENGWGRAHSFDAVGYLPGTHVLALGGGEFENLRKVADMAGFIWILNPADTIPSRKIQAYFYEGDRGEPETIISLAVSPDGKQIATGTITGEGTRPPNHMVTASVHILNYPSGALIGRPLDGLKFGAQDGLQYTSNGAYLIVGHGSAIDKTIHLIDARTLNVVDRVPSGGTTYDVTVNPSSTAFAAGVDKSIVLWSLPSS